MRAFAAALLALGLAGIARADPPRAEVEKLLGGYERGPTPERVRALGPGTDRVLCALAQDARISRLHRGRALALLADVQSPEGRELLRAVLRERAASSDPVDLRDARVAASALGEFGPEVARDLVPLLRHAAPALRRAAAEALARTRAPEAAPALRLRLAAEKDPAVLAAVLAALTALQ
jgi:HEAT repeat protein